MTQTASPRAAAICRVVFPLILLVVLQTAGNLRILAQEAPTNRPVARLVSTIAIGGSLGSGNSAGGKTASSARGPRVSSESAILVSDQEKRAFGLINEQRAAKGLRRLVMDVELCQMARAHSTNMSRSNVLNHVGSDGLDTADRARARGIVGWSALGENIAYNQGYADPEVFAVEKWMDSGKHRANILNATFTRSGIGIARSSDGTFYFTQVFLAR